MLPLKEMALPLKVNISGCSVDVVNGTYSRPAVLHNGYPVYKHISEGLYLFHDGVKRWMLNAKPGNSCFMMGEVRHESMGPTNVAKWVVYNDDDWQPEKEIKVVCAPRRKQVKPPAPSPGTQNLQLLRSLGVPLRYFLRFSNHGAVPEGWAAASDIQLRFWNEDPNETVDCPNKSNGCSWRGLRKRLPMHKNACPDILRVKELVKTAGGRCGTVAFSLSWTNDFEKTDIDMSVSHPCGFTIDFENQKCPMCSGALDVVDRNKNVVDRYKNGQQSIVNAVWTEDPPYGEYIVHISHFAGPALDFSLVAKAGNDMRLINGSIDEQEENQEVCCLEWGPQGPVFSSVKVKPPRQKNSSSPRAQWDSTTDEHGWCSIPDETLALRLDVPRGHEFSEYAPVDVYCKNIPLEVAPPKWR